VMNNYGIWANNLALPTGITTARDNEYVTYSSLAASNGHRLAYTNTSDPEGTYSLYGSNTEDDYMIVLLQGCAPATAVL
jgi:hypothetical protein